MQSDLRTKLMEALSKANGAFISGQEIAEYIGCSRTAVWKHIEDLAVKVIMLKLSAKKATGLFQHRKKCQKVKYSLAWKQKNSGK